MLVTTCKAARGLRLLARHCELKTGSVVIPHLGLTSICASNSLRFPRV